MCLQLPFQINHNGRFSDDFRKHQNNTKTRTEKKEKHQNTYEKLEKNTKMSAK